MLHIRRQRRSYFSLVVSLCAALLIVAGVASLVMPAIIAAQHRQAGIVLNEKSLGSLSSLLEPATIPLTNPTTITLPRISLQLPINTAHYSPSTKTWSLDSSHVFYIAPNSLDNTMPAIPIIYGHDIPNVFGHLSDVAPDEILTVTNQDGSKAFYTYKSDFIVNPSDDSVFRFATPRTLLLMTCHGTYYQNRRVLIFTYIGSQSASTPVKELSK